MNLCDFAPEYIRAIQPYQPGKPISELAREFELDEHSIIKLASNENPLGSSPLALEAMSHALFESARYPDGSGFELKKGLAEHHGVHFEQIILGNGSNDILDLAARVFLKPGAAAVYSQYAFAIYPLLAQAIGASGISVPARNYSHDIAAMLDAITPETRIAFIASPNNPTGTLSNQDELLHFLEHVSRDILVVLDEAYYEYLPETNKTNSISWLKQFPNLLVTRTFSKAYGLAGIRIGYGLAHPNVANLMNRIRQPFNVSNIGLVGALAALKDNEFINRSYALNRAGMLQLTDGFRRLNIDYIHSYGNFITFRIAGNPINTEKINHFLLQQGIIVRPLGSYDMPCHLRTSVGLESENHKLLNALEHAIKELG